MDNVDMSSSLPEPAVFYQEDGETFGSQPKISSLIRVSLWHVMNIPPKKEIQRRVFIDFANQWIQRYQWIHRNSEKGFH